MARTADPRGQRDTASTAGGLAGSPGPGTDRVGRTGLAAGRIGRPPAPARRTWVRTRWAGSTDPAGRIAAAAAGSRDGTAAAAGSPGIAWAGRPGADPRPARR